MNENSSKPLIYLAKSRETWFEHFNNCKVWSGPSGKKTTLAAFIICIQNKFVLKLSVIITNREYNFFLIPVNIT